MKAGMMAALISDKVGLHKSIIWNKDKNIKSTGGHSSRYLLDMLVTWLDMIWDRKQYGGIMDLI